MTIASRFLAGLCLALPQADRAPFVALDFEAARARSIEQQRLLFVDFTADWCGPCKRMDADTWAHEDVRAWLGEHALAIQVDVDEQRELARRLRIKAMPTVVVLKAGEEFDRAVGYQGSAEFLSWARGVREGRRRVDALERKAEDLRRRADELANSEEVDLRYDLAGELLDAGEYGRALEHYLWLWPATREVPAMAGVRLSFMLGEMSRLAREYPPADEAFRRLLAEAQGAVELEGPPELTTWNEWESLCGCFGERARLLAWYEARRDDKGRLFPNQEAEPVVRVIVDDLFKGLVEADRLEEALRLLGDVGAWARRTAERHRELVGALQSGLDRGQESLDQQLAPRNARFARDMARAHGVCVALGRDEDAAAVAAALLAELDTPEGRAALVHATLPFVTERDPRLVRWLDEAEAAGANVVLMRRRLARLREPSGR